MAAAAAKKSDLLLGAVATSDGAAVGVAKKDAAESVLKKVSKNKAHRVKLLLLPKKFLLFAVQVEPCNNNTGNRRGKSIAVGGDAPKHPR